jgi:hypothetical protein
MNTRIKVFICSFYNHNNSGSALEFISRCQGPDQFPELCNRLPDFSYSQTKKAPGVVS